MIIQRLFYAFNQTHSLRQSRIKLYQLPAHLLEDLAINQQQVDIEYKKNSLYKLTKEFFKQFKNGDRYGN